MRKSTFADKVDRNTRAAIVIQSAVRGFLNRKKFFIKPRPFDKISNEKVDYVGNDPDNLLISNELKSKKPFAMVGTSGLRALDITMQFCADGTDFIPKIYIVDTNKKIHHFWTVIKNIFSSSDILEQLIFNIIKERYTLIPLLQGEDFPYAIYEVKQLMKKILSKHCFERVKKTINSLCVLTHDWTDEKAFIQIKNICDRIGLDRVYAYPSNILSCIDYCDFYEDKDVYQMIINLETLQPHATVYSNLNRDRQCPDAIFCDVGTGVSKELKIDVGLGAFFCFSRKIHITSSSDEKKTYEEKAMYYTRVFVGFFQKREYSLALEYAEQAYFLYRAVYNSKKINTASELATLSHNLGAVLQELGKSEKAKQYLEQAYFIRFELGQPNASVTKSRLDKDKGFSLSLFHCKPCKGKSPANIGPVGTNSQSPS